MSRRPNGEGNIYLRNDGRWAGSVRIGDRRRYVYGKTRKEVADQLAQIRNDAMLGVTVSPSGKTVEAYLKEWREGADHLRPTTAYLYDLLIRVHIVPSIGHVKLKTLAPLHLQECYRRINGARTREQVHRLLHKALGDAVNLRLMTHNPASMLTVPTAKPAKKQRWTLHETRAFITTCSRLETLYDALWLFMLGTSCRIGEALALREEQVDWNTGIVSIEHGIVRIGTERRETLPKTEDSVRRISLPQFALDALKHRRPYLWDGYFFRTQGGTIPWTSDLQKRLKEACYRAAVPLVTSHDLRKAHASLAIAGGVDAKTVQNRLGHATLGLTLGLYAEAMEIADTKAAEVLDKLLSPNVVPEP